MTDRETDTPGGRSDEDGRRAAAGSRGKRRARSRERRGRAGEDRWEDRHEAEDGGADRAEQGAHRRPSQLASPGPARSDGARAHSPQQPPRSLPHHTFLPPTCTVPAPDRPSDPPPSSPQDARMPARALLALLALLHCPLCSPPALLHAPVTLHCGHTFCAAHLASSSSPPTPRPPNAAPVLPTCPLPACSSSSRAPTTFSHAPPLDVTVSKLIDILTTPIPEDTARPAFHDDPDDRTDSEYEADSGSDLEYLPLPPQSPSSASSQLPSPTPREPDASGRATPTRAESRHRARSGSQPSPRLPPRKRRRRLHRRVSPARTPASPHRTDHDPQSRLEKELLTELTCQICFGLLSQPLTTPCQHTFCNRCLFRSLDHNQSCPLCRQNLPGYDYFQQHPCNKVILAIILKAFPAAYAERGATIEAEERDARLDTPVFVCQLSFPGMPTMLHFFEPRYRLMLRRCMDSAHPCFGMIPPPRAAPTASAAGSSTGNDYGTMLAIRNVRMLPDGRSLVETWGTWRFRIMERGTLDGYTVARVERIEDYEEELDDGPAESEDPSEADPALDADDEGVRQSPHGGRAMGSTAATEGVEEPHEAAVRAELEDAVAAPQTAPPVPPRSRAGAIHASSSTGSAADLTGDSQPHDSHASVAPTDKHPAASGAIPPSPQIPRPPTNAELMAKCHAFIDQMREGTPWVVQHLNNNYVPMPDDPASFSFWMALLLPIDEHEKAKLLPIRSPRLRLRLVVHWIEQLNSNWWFSGGCVVC
ncbi:hypothetical protein C2E23DRAFT_821252 [Lenzites betulinus]|nr:hypothetical protein C2E23DRAFT_821252 [Lenzites betulinus]